MAGSRLLGKNRIYSVADGPILVSSRMSDMEMMIHKLRSTPEVEFQYGCCLFLRIEST